MAGLEYAVLTLEWDEEQVTPQVAIVWGMSPQMLESKIDDLLGESDEDLWANELVQVLREEGYKVDVPTKIVTYNDWDECIISDNHTGGDSNE